MHHIRKKIIDLLTYSEALRYAQLRPKRTESNLFAYHLRELIKDGYIKKLPDRGYALSAYGKSYVDRLSHETLAVRQQPKVVTMLAVRNTQGQYLFARRKHQPCIHMVTFPFGKIHLQESLLGAATRELQEKTGINNVPLCHSGMFSVQLMEDDQLVSHIIGQVFTGRIDVDVSSKTGNGRVEPIWGELGDFDGSEIIPGTSDLIGHLESDQFFVDDKVYSL